MKQASLMLSVFTGLLLAFVGAGCKKQAATQQAPQTIEEGVQKLKAALVKASPEVNSNLYNGVDYNTRYGNTMQAMMALDRIVSDPSLNEQQKKVANDVLELFKRELQKGTAKASP